MPIHNYGRITGVYDRALVLGCGPSMTGLSRDSVDKAIADGVAVICVNRSSYDFPCTHWVTHHPMEIKHPTNAICYAGVKENQKIPALDGVTFIRCELMPDANQTWHKPDMVYECNSGFMGIQVALKLNAKSIGIIGIEARDIGYYNKTWNPAHDDFDYLVHCANKLKPYLDDKKIIINDGSVNGRLPFNKCSQTQVIERIVNDNC